MTARMMGKVVAVGAAVIVALLIATFAFSQSDSYQLRSSTADRWITPGPAGVVKVLAPAACTTLAQVLDQGLNVLMYLDVTGSRPGWCAWDGNSHYGCVYAGDSTANLNWYWPTAAPGGNYICKIDAGGQMSTVAEIALGTETSGNYVNGVTANQGLLMTGTEGATLGLIDCDANYILQRDAGDTQWQCADPGGLSVAVSGTSTIADDTTTNATMYPTWVTAASGDLPLYVSSTKLTFNPSTGKLTASGGYVGNADTATALAADPADCAAGQIALGVNASGTAQCTANPSVTTITGDLVGNADTASALAADPSDCAAGEFANAIAANGNLTCAVPAGGITWSVKTAAFNAATLNGYMVDTATTGAVTATLPAAPSVGDYMLFTDAASNFDVANLTIARNGLNIMGLAEDMTVNLKNAAFGLVYESAAYGWRVY